MIRILERCDFVVMKTSGMEYYSYCKDSAHTFEHVENIDRAKNMINMSELCGVGIGKNMHKVFKLNENIDNRLRSSSKSSKSIMKALKQIEHMLKNL